jgi:predicted DNA-binding transcriptional regulator
MRLFVKPVLKSWTNTGRKDKVKEDEKLNKDKALGLLILMASLGTTLLYGWLLFFSQWALFALELTFFIAITLVLGIISWIGYTLVSTPKLAEEADEDTIQNKPNHQ